MKKYFSVFVNTTDSFEDCWYPFFKLFKKYYPDFNGRIYLNTETKEFNFEGLEIISLKNGLTGHTWSECLIKSLNGIEEDYILYMQDDYFLNAWVNSTKVNELFDLMSGNNINCIHLHRDSTVGPFENSKYDDIVKYSKKAAYKIGTQASLWNKRLMLEYLRKHETAWHFEIFGTRRAWRNNEEIYKFDFDKNDKDIIPYKPTGIVKGRWLEEAVVNLFEENDISIDFSKRGFYIRDANKYKTPLSLKKIINRVKSLF